MAVDTGHAALRQGLMGTRSLSRLLRKIHGRRRMTAAALRGVIGFEFLPNLLRQLHAMSFLLFRRVELASHVTPNLGVRLNMPP